ncbi:uncharacterized protein JCM10292_002761 [Rhodotorula paludigena]|uniref:uncharacterized protein n=1 Tax=Rhodotorula paludigena TaxID=86838 RepID=UPI00317AE989
MRDVGDLISQWCGYLGTGCAIWNAVPQIYAQLEDPRVLGPRWTLLNLWLLGDIGQTSGMFIHTAQIPHKISGIVFGVTDLIIMCLKMWNAGWFGVRRWRRKSDDDEAKHESNHLLHQRSGADEASEHRLSIDLTRGPVDMTLETYRWFTNFNGWRTNGIVLVLMFGITGGCWAGLDFARRNSLPALEPSFPPHDTRSWVGWITGMFGMVCYNVARIFQMRDLRPKEGKPADTSVLMFAWLILQNVFLLTALLTVSHTGPALYGSAPFLSNMGCALIADFIIVGLSYWYKKHPIASGHHHATSASDEETQLPARTGSHDLDFKRKELEDHLRDSLEQEQKLLDGGPSALPPLLRPKRVADLDARLSREQGQLDSLRARAKEAGQDEIQKQKQWMDKTANLRSRLRATRRARVEQVRRVRKEDEEDLRRWKEKRGGGVGVHSDSELSSAETTEHKHGDTHDDLSSELSTDSSERSWRPLHHGIDASSLGKSGWHPRRGVGTSSRV